MRDKHKDKKRFSVILVTAFIVFSMVVSIFAIVLDNQSQSIPDYNKYSFAFTDVGYKTKINNKYLDFYYYPADLENINMSSDIISLLKNSQSIGFVFDPEDNVTDNLLYIDVIRYDLQTQLDKTVDFGISQNSTKYILPVMDCSSAAEYYPIIIIDTSSDDGFAVSDNPYCIVMNARLKNILAAKDRLVYSYYGVMN
ncbi:MAG: hypothetical protein ACP5NW_02795 [Candidatus Woesearchaeota archaeon]